MLTTTIMACPGKVIFSPAMNVHMFENPILQDNLEILRKYGYEIVEPAVGYLACGDTGAGKMPEPETLYQYILRELACEKDMKGLRVLVTAGPTREAIDPVRYITNHSSGKMGYAIARRAMLPGRRCDARIRTDGSGTGAFCEDGSVVTAQEMFEAVRDHLDEQDILIKSAAVADYRPASVSEEKVKKTEGDMSISLERTQDILGYVAEHRREDQVICGFSMETQNMLENSRKKLTKKKLDMIAANNVKDEGAGFATDTNLITIITKQEERALPLMTKEEAAHELLSYILSYRAEKR